MIRLGICRPVTDIAAVEAIGYDFLETPLGALAEMDDATFEETVRIAEGAGIGVEAFHGLLPASFRIVGPEPMAADALDAYLHRAFARATRFAGRVVILGSGHARRCPEGFPMAEASAQLDAFLIRTDAIAGQYGITIAIEPLNTTECNQINLVSQAVARAKLLALPHTAAMADTYHMCLMAEPFAAIAEAGPWIRHVHIAEPARRAFPSEGDGQDYPGLFGLLRGMGYDARLSVEGHTDDFVTDATVAFALLDRARREESS